VDKWQIVEVVFLNTKTGKPMIRLVGRDKQIVNGFEVGLDRFAAAGWASELATLKEKGIESRIRCHATPIEVEVSPDGKYWKLESVLPRAAGWAEDAVWLPDLVWYRTYAHRVALLLLQWPTVFFDTETTGTHMGAEMVSIYANYRWALDGEVFEQVINRRVKPSEPIPAEAAAVHGITNEMVADAPDFAEVYRKELLEVMLWSRWAAYNVQFDVRVLEQACMRADVPMPESGGIFDVMELYAKWSGNWDVERQQWKYVKLSEALEREGL